jgi:hypothetical protein
MSPQLNITTANKIMQGFWIGHFTTISKAPFV